MKIKYDKPKGQRVNKYFIGMCCKSKEEETYWYFEEYDRWCILKEGKEKYGGIFGNYNNDIRTLKTAIRKIKKYSKYLPKGTVFRLNNKYVGYDIEITI